MIPAVPERRPHAEDDPLDPERPASDPDAAGPAPEPSPPAEPPPAAGSPGPGDPADSGAPGLREQVRRTRDALLGLVRAHVDLGRAEFDEIKGEVARAAGLGAAAIGCLVFLGLLLPIGLILFTGEWLFGSIGWGVLHGSLLLVAIAVAAVLAALRTGGIGRALVMGLLVGVVVAALLGPSLPNRAWAAIGDATGLGVDTAMRPLVVGLLVGAVAGAVIGLLAGLRAGGAGVGLVVGLLVGTLLGGFLAIDFGWPVGIALGVVAALKGWIALMALGAARSGIDEEALKARFWPQATIDTTKETIEWAKARMPLGPRS